MIDITQLSPEQRAQLLAELQAESQTTEVAPPPDPTPAAQDQPTPSDPAATYIGDPAPAQPTSGGVTLDDLANDPTLLDTLSPEEAFNLYSEAEQTGVALAGVLFSKLYRASEQDGKQGR